jgi:hypothetical protein
MNIRSSPNGNTKPEDFEINYVRDIVLISCNMWYSRHNIFTKFKTNKLKCFDVTKWNIIIFPEGNYDFEDIQDYINDHFQTNDPPIKVHANTVTLRTIILLKSGEDEELGLAYFQTTHPQV